MLEACLDGHRDDSRHVVALVYRASPLNARQCESACMTKPKLPNAMVGIYADVQRASGQDGGSGRTSFPSFSLAFSNGMTVFTERETTVGGIGGC